MPPSATNAADAFTQIVLYWAIQDDLSLEYRLRRQLGGSMAKFLTSLGKLSLPDRARIKSAIVEFMGRGALPTGVSVRSLLAFVDAPPGEGSVAGEYFSDRH